MTRQLIFGITGASGACYAKRLLQQLIAADVHVHLIISPHGKQLLSDELDIHQPTVESLAGGPTDKLTIYPYNEMSALPASGSFLHDGMIICPCSAHTMGALAGGLGDNLLHRAAQVTLKEQRRLILVYREMPMSQIDLNSALTLSRAGATICPANSGFYLRPQSVSDLVDFVAGKVLDLLGIEHSLNTRWKP